MVIGWLPQVADVIKTSNTTKSAVRPVSFAPGVQERHVILCGSVCAGNLKSRLQELFHADHGIHNVRWVKVRQKRGLLKEEIKRV